MTDPRVALVVNPASGSGRAARLAEPVAERLRAGARVSVVRADSPTGSRDLVRTARADHDAVVVLGGDGIVHLAAQELAQGDIPLGIVPAGTGNDVADVLGLPADPLAACDAVLDALAAGTTRRLDLGRTANGRWWVTVLCAGFDSAVTERANRLRWPRGRFASRRYDLAIALEFLRMKPRAFTLDLDGARLDRPAILVAVGNGPQYGAGKRIAGGARWDDGTFLVTVVAPVSRRDFARLAPTLATAGHLVHPAVSQHVARRVEITAADTLGYADGERIGPLPIATECVPGALPVLVPPS